MSKHNIGFAISGTVMTIIFLGVVNYLTSPHYLWFIYPAATLMLWPVTYMLISSRKYKEHALIGCITVMFILTVLNYFYSVHPWILYTLFPIACWPIAVYSGRRAKTLLFAITISLAAIIYYTVLNMFMSPQYPWAIFPSFVVLWWPMTLYYVRRRQYFMYAVAASLLTSIFFIAVNVISSPHTVWAIYPIFAVLWWPLSLYFYYELKRS